MDGFRTSAPRDDRATRGIKRETRETKGHDMTEVLAPEVAPAAPAAPEPAAPAETPATISKTEHDAAMAKQRIEMKELQAAAKELAELKKAQMTAEDALKADLEAARAEAQAARADAEALKLSALRTSIGAELGLPAKIAALIPGIDEDSIRAAAADVLSALPTPPPQDAPGARPGGDAPLTEAEMIRKAFREG